MFHDKSFKEIRDALSGLLLVLFSLVYLFMSTQIKTNLNNGIGGSKFIPRVIGTGLLIIGIYLLVTGFLKLKGSDTAASSAESRKDWKAAIMTLLFLLAYSLLLKRVGFLICTFIYLVAMMCLLAPRKDWNLLRFAVISLAADLIIYLMFTKVFSLVLPMGLIIF